MSVLAYLVAVWLLLVGIYGVITSRHLVHLVTCLSVTQASTYVLLLGIGYRDGGQAPIFGDIPTSTPGRRPGRPGADADRRRRRRDRERAPARARRAGAQALRLGRPRRARRAARLMALTSLAILVPLVAAALLAGTTSLRRRRVADVVALTAATRSPGSASRCSRALRRTGRRLDGRLAARGGVALGIALFGDPLGAGLAAFAALLAAAGARRLAPGRHRRAPLPRARADLARGHGRLLPFGRPLHRLRLLRAHGRERVRARGLPRRGARAAGGRAVFAITNSVGALMFLVGIALVYGRTGALNLAQIGEALAGRRPTRSWRSPSR